MDAVPFHIGVTTNDLTKSMHDLTEALNVTWTDLALAGGDDGFRTVDGTPQDRPLYCVSREGPIHFDLIEGKPTTVWETSEPKIHHFAYWTDDLEGDINRLLGDGWTLEMTRADENGRPSDFAYLLRSDGFRVELMHSGGRSRYEDRVHE